MSVMDMTIDELVGRLARIEFVHPGRFAKSYVDAMILRAVFRSLDWKNYWSSTQYVHIGRQGDFWIRIDRSRLGVDNYSYHWKWGIDDTSPSTFFAGLRQVKSLTTALINLKQSIQEMRSV